jgi:uncharacterized protein CbrC (UPF0167 family)
MIGRLSEALPTFRYYRDPVGDGTIERSGVACSACGRARGVIVTSTIYAADIPKDARFCPWCVADGTAHSRFGAFFNGVEPGADPSAAAEVRERTPGFPTWQDFDWPTHCEDVGVFLGEPSGDELRANPEALEALLSDIRQWDWGRDEDYVNAFVDGLGGSQVVYLFECPRCGKQLVRWDQD